MPFFVANVLLRKDLFFAEGVVAVELRLFYPCAASASEPLLPSGFPIRLSPTTPCPESRYGASAGNAGSLEDEKAVNRAGEGTVGR